MGEISGDKLKVLPKFLIW